jgi:hypothetical protein
VTTNPGPTSVIRTASSFAVLAVLGLAAPAQAQLQYQFADATGAASASFNVQVGSTVAVRVYLRDTTGGAPTLGANGGLGAAAVRVSYTNSASASIASDAVPSIPPWEYGTTLGTVAGASAVVNDGSDIAGVLPSGDRILLGTFTFTGHAVGSSSLTALDPNPGSGTDTAYYGNGAGLDALIGTATATVNVTPVPEPAVLALAAGVLSAGAALRRTRRR